MAVARNVLAMILLTRWNQHIVNKVCPENQFGFRKEQGTVDMLLVAEKSREQYKNSSIAFIDLSKAFGTDNRNMLCEVLERLGCPTMFSNVVRSFHDGILATVLVGGEQTDAFGVGVGVKQGCAMAPVFF